LFSSAWFWMLAGGFMIIAVPSGWLMAVRQRWSGMNANLSVLALLPGLGTPAEQKRRVLHAALLQPMSWLLGVLLACWIVVVVIHASPAIGAYALLVVVGSGALLCTAVLGSLGGKPLSGFALGALFVVLLVLMGVTPGLDKLPRIFFESGSAVVATRQAVATCWLAWLAVVGVLAVRGWRCLQRRPHPFLANDR
ncbi:MAG: hypothetical protein ACREP2_03885, partial [Rhodanobacteraceae bacterium]